jgi:hypothetical protein
MGTSAGETFLLYSSSIMSLSLYQVIKPEIAKVLTGESTIYSSTSIQFTASIASATAYSATAIHGLMR